MRFVIRPITQQDVDVISGWRYAAPYDVYVEDAVTAENECYQALCDEQGALCGLFCWDAEAQVPVAADVYAAQPNHLDFGIGLRPGLTGKGIGLFACLAGLNWLTETFGTELFRLGVYEWNKRARRVYSRIGFVPVTKRGDFLLMEWDRRPWREASRPLQNGMRVYPDDPPFERRLSYTVAQCGFDTSCFSMGAHAGTHIDSPAHLGLESATETVPLDSLNGPVQLLEGIKGICSPRILLKMGGRGLTPDEARAVVTAGVSMVGTDHLSIGEGDTERETHAVLLEAGITVLENAAIEDFEPGWYEMRCLPLLMPGSDGAPVRLQLRRETP